MQKAFFTIFLLAAVLAIASCRDETLNFPAAVATFAGRDGSIKEPFGIAVREGSVFVSDGANNVIWRIDATGAASVFASGFDTPSQIAFAPDGRLMVADTGTHTIRSVDQNGIVSIVAGRVNEPGDNDGAIADSRFRAPIGVAVDQKGRIFVADTYNDRIRVIDNGTVRTLAGSIRGYAEGREARFDTPTGLLIWKERLLVADTGNDRIRAVEEDGSTWTLAGGGETESPSATLANAAFYHPVGMAAAPDGSLFVADRNTLFHVGGVTPRVVALNERSRGLRDGELRTSRFFRISGLATDDAGNIFIADSDASLVRVAGKALKFAPISAEEKVALIDDPERFGKIGPPRWPYEPPDGIRDVPGSFGELRGKVTGNSTDELHFHNGVDIAGKYGEEAHLIWDEKTLDPIAADNFGTLRELVQFPHFGYIHLRLGRFADGRMFDDARFLFSRDAAGRIDNVRIPRGTKFFSGDPIGTLNPMNHVHLVAGRGGQEMDPLEAIAFPGLADHIAPVIDAVHFSINGNEIETNARISRIELAGNAAVIVEAYDRMDGNAERRRLGLHRAGWQLLNADDVAANDIDWTIKFDRLPASYAVPLVFAKDSYSGATGVTRFRYIVSNRVDADTAQTGVIRLNDLAPGRWKIRVFASDRAGNTTTKDIPFEVTQ